MGPWVLAAKEHHQGWQQLQALQTPLGDLKRTKEREPWLFEPWLLTMRENHRERQQPYSVQRNPGHVKAGGALEPWLLAVKEPRQEWQQPQPQRPPEVECGTSLRQLKAAEEYQSDTQLQPTASQRQLSATGGHRVPGRMELGEGFDPLKLATGHHRHLQQQVHAPSRFPKPSGLATSVRLAVSAGGQQRSDHRRQQLAQGCLRDLAPRVVALEQAALAREARRSHEQQPQAPEKSPGDLDLAKRWGCLRVGHHDYFAFFVWTSLKAWMAGLLSYGAALEPWRQWRALPSIPRHCRMNLPQPRQTPIVQRGSPALLNTRVRFW